MVPTQRRYRLSFIFGMYLSVYTHVYIAWKFWRFFGFGKWCLNFPCFGSTQKIIQRVTKTNKTFEHSGLVSKVASFFLPPPEKKKKKKYKRTERISFGILQMNIVMGHTRSMLRYARYAQCIHTIRRIVECGMWNVKCWMLNAAEYRISNIDCEIM